MVPDLVRAVHEAGHATVALFHDIRVHGCAIEKMSELRYGQTVTAKPEPDDAALALACRDFSAAERLAACRAYAQISLGGLAGEIVATETFGRAIAPPTPCTDARIAERYLRLATMRGNLRLGALDRELRAAVTIIRDWRPIWEGLASELRMRQRLTETDVYVVVARRSYVTAQRLRARDLAL